MNSWLRCFAICTSLTLLGAPVLAQDGGGLAELGIDRELRWTVVRTATGATYLGLPRADALLLHARLPQAAHLIVAERARGDAAAQLAETYARTASAAMQRGDALQDIVDAVREQREAERPTLLAKIAAHPVTWAIALVVAFGGGVALGAKLVR